MEIEKLTEIGVCLPQPKFKIGDRVYYVLEGTISERLPCPDCLDQKTWRAIAPSGTEFTVDCPRCCRQLCINGIPSLDAERCTYSVQSLTIGSVRINTEDDHPVSYMCLETGVGTGRIYYEHLLFADKESAERAGQEEANSRTHKAQNTPEALATRHFSRLQINAACLEAARTAAFRGWYAYHNLMEKVNEYLKGSDEKHHLQSEIDFEIGYQAKHGTQPLMVLIRAAQKYASDPDIAKALAPFIPQTYGLPEITNGN